MWVGLSLVLLHYKGLAFSTPKTLLLWLQLVRSHSDFVQRVTIELCMVGQQQIFLRRRLGEHHSWFCRCTSSVLRVGIKAKKSSLNFHDGVGAKPSLGILKEYRTFGVPWPVGSFTWTIDRSANKLPLVAVPFVCLRVMK